MATFKLCPAITAFEINKGLWCEAIAQPSQKGDIRTTLKHLIFNITALSSSRTIPPRIHVDISCHLTLNGATELNLAS